MISRDALYTFIENLISESAVDSALDQAQVFRNLRTPVDEATKVVRVECFVGQFGQTDEDKRKELGVLFTVQCWAIPADETQVAMDDATDLSFDMARAIFEGIAADPALDGTVCDCYADEFETGEANLGTIRRGVTYLDGIMNRVS